MRCTQCAAVSYSAAARTLVSRGERCAVCGGEVVLDLEPPAAPVATGARERKEPASSEGRFERD
jgi:hypothetical protein